MIVNNSALGFSKAQSGCDCRFSEFALPVALADSTYWQVNIACDELTGTNVKLPCESNLIGAYTDNFARYQNDIGPEALLPTYLISATDIRFEDFESAGNIFSTPVGFLPANTCFFLRYTVSGYSDGYVQTVVDASEPQRTTGPNPSREANGTYSEVYCTDADGRLRFQIGNDDDTTLSTFILSNIFIGCIRYSVLYDLLIDPADEDLVTFEGATKICKGETANSVLVSLREVPFIEGQTYKICFTLSGSTGGSVDLLFNSTTPDTYSGNGFYCTELEYEDATLATQLQFELSADFDGCIQDISVHLVADYRIGLFDADDQEVENALTVEQIGSALKVNLNPDVPEGCYTIGIADNCSNFLSQFYGNILLGEYYSQYLNFTLGTFPGSFYPITRSGNDFSFDFSGWADLPNGSVFRDYYFILPDSICCEKLYDMVMDIAIDDNGNTVDSIDISVVLASELVATDTVLTPGTSAVFTFDDLIAGNCNENISEGVGVSETLAALIGQNGTFIRIGLSITKANATAPEIGFSAGDSFLIMDQDTPQFCPEYYSVALNVTAEAPCDTVLIKYRNPNNAFGFDYTSAGFTETDGFYNQVRIDGKLWKPNYPRTQETQKASTGYRTKYYADIDKVQTLTTGLLPEFIHDALSDAVDHETLIIEDQYFVNKSEEYSPNWDKSTDLASVELELFVQQSRKLNTKC